MSNLSTVTVAPERVSESDQRLLGRLLARQEALQRAANEIGGIVLEHLTHTYDFRAGDKVMVETDWSIVRAEQGESADE